MPHLVKLDDVWLMLDECAPGHTRKASQEFWCISYKGKSVRSLPRGPHGHRRNPAIETGHIRHMARHLGIFDCASKHLALTF